MTNLVFLACFILAALLGPVETFAHGTVGKRVFPVTFMVDDPSIEDEFSLLPSYIQDGDARTFELGIGGSKRITPNFGFQFDDAFDYIKMRGDGHASGFQNLGIGFKWKFYTNDFHEVMMSFGTGVEIGHTGSSRVGADSFSNITPLTYYVGKGFGDLPDCADYFRPFAITGVVGYTFPSRAFSRIQDDTGHGWDKVRNPSTLNWGLTLQYSFSYLQQQVKDIGLIVPFDRMTLVCEFPMVTELERGTFRSTTGYINPGVVWVGKTMEYGVCAQIPVNSASGSNVGVIVLIHFFLDDIFPNSLGRPIFQ